MCERYTDTGGRKMANPFIYKKKIYIYISEQINPLSFVLQQAQSVTVEGTAELLDN